MPARPAGGWCALVVQFRERFVVLAEERGLLTPLDLKFRATAERKRRMRRKPGTPGAPTKRAILGSARGIENRERRDHADGIMRTAGAVTIRQLCRMDRSLSWSFWKEYLTEGVRRGVLNVLPEPKASQDRYEWNNQDCGGGGDYG